MKQFNACLFKVLWYRCIFPLRSSKRLHRNTSNRRLSKALADLSGFSQMTAHLTPGSNSACLMSTFRVPLPCSGCVRRLGHCGLPITQLMLNHRSVQPQVWEAAGRAEQQVALHSSHFTLKTSCVSSMQYTLMLYSSVEQYASEKSTSLRRLAAPMCRDSPTKAKVPSCSENSRHVSASSWQ